MRDVGKQAAGAQYVNFKQFKNLLGSAWTKSFHYKLLRKKKILYCFEYYLNKLRYVKKKMVV